MFNFGQALQLIREGKKLFRLGWNGKNMFVVYQKGYPDGIPCNKQTAEAWGLNEGDLFKVRPYLQLRCADGTHAMWVPSVSDILAEDWEEVLELKSTKEVKVEKFTAHVNVSVKDTAAVKEMLEVMEGLTIVTSYLISTADKEVIDIVPELVPNEQLKKMLQEIIIKLDVKKQETPLGEFTKQTTQVRTPVAFKREYLGEFVGDKNKDS